MKCLTILVITWLNNILPSTKKYLERLTGIYDIDRFNLKDDTSIAGPDLTWLLKSICCCKCYSSWRFLKQLFKPGEYAWWKLSFSHTKKPKRQVGWFWSHILSELDFHFIIIAVSEIRIYNNFFFFISIQAYITTTLGSFQRLFFLWRWASKWGTLGSVEWTTI